jgi:hypothetical protein
MVGYERVVYVCVWGVGMAFDTAARWIGDREAEVDTRPFQPRPHHIHSQTTTPLKGGRPVRSPVPWRLQLFLCVSLFSSPSHSHPLPIHATPLRAPHSPPVGGRSGGPAPTRGSGPWRRPSAGSSPGTAATAPGRPWYVYVWYRGVWCGWWPVVPCACDGGRHTRTVQSLHARTRDPRPRRPSAATRQTQTTTFTHNTTLRTETCGGRARR